MIRPKSIILIRRDNIGDLICTTPAIHALRKQLTDIKIGVLVNSYNADAIRNNPDIDDVYIYEKEKHARDKNRFSVWASNLNVLRKIRREKYDVAIGCSNKYSSRLARYTYLTGAEKRIGYIPVGKGTSYYNFPLNEPLESIHEVISTVRLLEPLGISDENLRLVLKPYDIEKRSVKEHLASEELEENNIVAVHISSRKANNRWPVGRFVALGNELGQRYKIRPLILWAPGSKENPLHPGDDEAAAEIVKGMISRPVLYKTSKLGELIAALSLARLVICLDGGAMHIAAALGKPIIAIWGSTDVRRWSPWGVKHIILQKGSEADAITIKEVLSAFDSMWKMNSSFSKAYDK